MGVTDFKIMEDLVVVGHPLGAEPVEVVDTPVVVVIPIQVGRVVEAPITSELTGPTPSGIQAEEKLLSRLCRSLEPMMVTSHDDG